MNFERSVSRLCQPVDDASNFTSFRKREKELFFQLQSCGLGERMKSPVVGQQHLTSIFEICPCSGSRSDDSHLGSVAFLPFLLIERKNFIARVRLPLHGIRVQFFERPVDGISKMKLDASYGRRNFINISKLILLWALLVRSQLAMRKTRHRFTLREAARLF